MNRELILPTKEQERLWKIVEVDACRMTGKEASKISELSLRQTKRLAVASRSAANWKFIKEVIELIFSLQGDCLHQVSGKT